MHDLKPITALGGNEPQTDVIGTITIAENDGVALASVAARLGNDPEAGFWMGPDQWMVGAPMTTHEDLAEQLKSRFGNTASITEQSGAWVVFDVTGTTMRDMCELLCNVPIRRMQAGDVQRTMIHQMGCFVIRRKADDHIRILGPRASAKSLHHVLLTAARSVA